MCRYQFSTAAMCKDRSQQIYLLRAVLARVQNSEDIKMEHLIIPEDYFSPLSLYDTQVAIKTVKDFFRAYSRSS